MPYSQKRQENWQDFGSTLPRLKWKVILGGSLVSIILIFFLVISHKSLNQILNSVEKLSEPRKDGQILSDLMLKIADIEWHSGKYIASRKTSDLDEYFESVERAQLLVDSIHKTFHKEYPLKTDSLSDLYTKYIEVADSYLQIKTTNTLTTDYRLLDMIRTEKNIIKKIDSIQKPKTPEINTLPVTPVISNNPPQVENTKPKKRNRNKPKAEEIVVETAVVKQIEPQKNPEIDSTIIKKYNSLVENVQSTVTTGLKSKIELQKNTVKTENEISETQRNLFEQLMVILNDLDQKEKAITRSESIQASNTVVKNANILSWLAIIIIAILLTLSIIVFSDVSKSLFYRDKLQEARAFAEKQAIAKEDFLSNMSHEIRTPLNSIIGFAEQLNQGDLQPGQRAKVHALIRSGDHLISLVNDILDYTKIESGSLKLESIGFSITDIIDEVIEVMEPEARKKEVDILFEPDESSDILVSGDPVRLRQILLNLVGNAVKFTEKGHVEIKVRQIKSRNNNPLFEFKVIDTGVGISPEKLTTIFSKFEQADVTVSRKFGGSGLGLSICKKLVEMQNGTIHAMSTLGKGSIFTFAIPYQLSDKNQYNVATIETDRNSGLQNRRILVVDDDPMTEILLKPMFTQNGAFVRFEKNPLVALNICKSEKFDMVMTDLHMPQMDGESFLENLRKTPGFENTQTILCTGNVMKKIESDAVDSIIYKPYKMNELLQVFEKMLDSSLHMPELENEGGDFSMEYFNTFAGNDPSQLSLFVNLFIENSRQEINKIKANFELGNTEAVGESAHLLKNTYGQLKARDCMRLIARLEGLVDEKYLDDKEISKLISELESSSEILFNKLDEYISTHQTSNP